MPIRLERACSSSDICAFLKQEDIYLKHVIQVVSDFDYLCLYTGLETLDLRRSMSFKGIQHFCSHILQICTAPSRSFTSGVEDNLREKGDSDASGILILRTSFNLLYSLSEVNFDRCLSGPQAIVGRPDSGNALFVWTDSEALSVCPDCPWAPGPWLPRNLAKIVWISVSGLFLAKKYPIWPKITADEAGHTRDER